MPTYKSADEELKASAYAVLRNVNEHKPLLDAKVKIDLLYAFPKYDEKDNPIGDAIKQHGVKAIGLARICNLKERTKGHGDAEILIDYEWWNEAPDPERKALLDHELNHLSVQVNKNGILKTDDLGRPKLRMRKHDWQFGWFDAVAKRNGIHSQEHKQAMQIFEEAGQLYWPMIASAVHADNVEMTAKVVRRS